MNERTSYNTCASNHNNVAPAITEDATEGAKESASIRFFSSSYAYNFCFQILHTTPVGVHSCLLRYRVYEL